MNMRKKLSLREKERLGAAAAIPGLLVFLLLDGWLWTVLGLAMLAGGLGFVIRTLRCPACGKPLLPHPGRFCRCCGAKIDWDKKEE